MNKPVVSIIMSTYNDALYLVDAIESVLNQSFSNFEFIILNDASKDETEAIIKHYTLKDSRIKHYKNNINRGLVANLIKGAYLAKGEYLARIDGDDIWIDSNKLKKQVEFLNENLNYGLVGTWANIINQEGKKILTTKNPSTDKEIRNYILIENCFFHSSVMIRKSIFDKVGGYNKNIKTAEDYELWLKIGMVSKMHNIEEYMINYRVNPNGINSTKYSFQIQETINLVKQFKEYYPNYIIGILFWNLRKYVPQKIKTFSSNILKNKYFIKFSRQVKKLLFTLHYDLKNTKIS